MIIHEDLSRLDDIYCAISSLKRRLRNNIDKLSQHSLYCNTLEDLEKYIKKETGNIADKRKAIDRLKQTAKKELTRLLEELK